MEALLLFNFKKYRGKFKKSISENTWKSKKFPLKCLKE